MRRVSCSSGALRNRAKSLARRPGWVLMQGGARHVKGCNGRWLNEYFRQRDPYHPYWGW